MNITHGIFLIRCHIRLGIILEVFAFNHAATSTNNDVKITTVL